MNLKQIPFEELIKEAHVHFARSGGKGGQNVNKVETKVELTFSIEHSHVLTPEQKAILLETLGSKLDHEGNIHVTAHTERYQHANRKKAEEKLVKLIEIALKPKKQRKKTEPSVASKIARLSAKRKHSYKKSERKKASKLDE